MTEANIKASIKRYLDKYECMHFVYNPFMGGCAGIPDRVVLAPGYPSIWLEVKREGKEPTTLQKLRISQIIAAGHMATVVRSKEDVKQFFELHNIKLSKKGETNGPRNQKK